VASLPLGRLTGSDGLDFCFEVRCAKCGSIVRLVAGLDQDWSFVNAGVTDAAALQVPRGATDARAPGVEMLGWSPHRFGHEKPATKT
jgi:hypothetical protein